MLYWMKEIVGGFAVPPLMLNAENTSEMNTANNGQNAFAAILADFQANPNMDFRPYVPVGQVPPPVDHQPRPFTNQNPEENPGFPLDMATIIDMMSTQQSDGGS